MLKKVRQKATCIVFYDFDLEAVDLEHWFYTSIDLFESMNVPLIYLSANAEDIKWKKIKTFKYGKKFIEQRGFKKLEDLTIQSDCPEELPNSIERDASASIGISGKSYMVFYLNENFFPLNQRTIEKIILDFTKIIKPYYGIIYQREYFKGPLFYAWGIIVGLDDKYPNQAHEEDKITQWNHQYHMSDGNYRTGLLRDIYPLNLLSQTHLDESVYGITLEKWIKSSSDHGALKPLTSDVWSWWVPEDKISIVADALKDSGIIICT